MFTCSGPIFTSYSWSLDTFVDYAWQDLTKLSGIIIVLLVMEVGLLDRVSIADLALRNGNQTQQAGNAASCDG
jgi:hypothetical protein